MADGVDVLLSYNIVPMVPKEGKHAKLPYAQ